MDVLITYQLMLVICPAAFLYPPRTLYLYVHKRTTHTRSRFLLQLQLLGVIHAAYLNE